MVHGEPQLLVAGLSNLLRLDFSGQELPGGSVASTAPRSAVSFLTAVLMGIALCFHSLLEVGHSQGEPRPHSASNR